jgi:hypothetical protein
VISLDWVLDLTSLDGTRYDLPDARSTTTDLVVEVVMAAVRGHDHLTV